MGKYLDVICQVLYGIVLVTNTLWGCAACKLIGLTKLSEKDKQNYSLLCVSKVWRAAFFFTPWVRCETDDESRAAWATIQGWADEEVAMWESHSKPLMIIGNHTSFLDTLLCCGLNFPRKVLWRSRTYVNDALFRLPLIGTICKAAGHFPVHFRSSDSGKFEVDHEKMQPVDMQVEEHLASGGWVSFFPEGQINKEPDVLMPFRHGGMKKALKWNCRIVAFVNHNCGRVWPPGVKMGGRPAHVTYSTRILAPDGVRAYVNQVRSRPDLPSEHKTMPDYELLAVYLRDEMQAQYDDLKEAQARRGTKEPSADSVPHKNRHAFNKIADTERHLLLRA